MQLPRSKFVLCLAVIGSVLTLPLSARADDGYHLWLRYDRLANAPAIHRVVLATPSGRDSATIAAARSELAIAFAGLLGTAPQIALEKIPPTDPLGREGFSLRADPAEGVCISANTDLGVLYGAFDLLRRIQIGEPLSRLAFTSTPKFQRRLLNHWDNLNRFVERGYAGFSLWEWFNLPDIRSPRYRDYARACASIGLNGTVLTNVNADALVLTPAYLRKVEALADEFRPYGIRVYLTARFSAPIEIGGLPTADPLAPAVVAWWRAKVDEIYQLIPDFGGFLVKANSEGQPGPQDYGRTHADGANLFADALAPHGGIVMWRAFVYGADAHEDRVKHAYTQFQPLDGKFRDNVVVQIKNGPLDFMPREPFHPLFGAMPHTRLALELQITQEYLGGSTQLAFLAPMWKETLDADTFRPNASSTVAQIIAGDSSSLSVIAGVANTGNDRNWTGHPLAQANWYAFGRLAWDPSLPAAKIAEEWTKRTFGSDPTIVATISNLLIGSHETMVSYSMPLGLHHIMAEGHHHGPGPWITHQHAEWGSVYYHQADLHGLGAARSASGSNAVGQYAPELAQRWSNSETCPENLLLWFHHLAWDHRMKSGRTLWDELCLRYQQGVDEVRAMRRAWDSLAGRIDAERHTAVRERLVRQEQDARDWRDACLLYFQTFSQRPLPAGVEPAAHDLDYYRAIKLRYAPGDPAVH